MIDEGGRLNAAAGEATPGCVLVVDDQRNMRATTAMLLRWPPSCASRWRCC
jgi:hypothetical protein